MTKKLKIVLDTNALISTMSNRLDYELIFDALIQNRYNLFISNEILLEYEEKISHFFNEKSVKCTLKLFTILPNIHKTLIYYHLNLGEI